MKNLVISERPLEGVIGIHMRNIAGYKPSYHSVIERFFGQTSSTLLSTPALTKSPHADGQTMSLSDLKLLMVERKVLTNGEAESHVDEGKNGEASEEGPGTR